MQFILLSILVWCLFICFGTLAEVQKRVVSRWLPCKRIRTKQTCVQSSSCCFDETSRTCFSPNLDDDFDCAKISDRAACNVWIEDCRWSKSAKRCIRLPIVNKSTRCSAALEFRRKQKEKDNTFCWGQRTKKPCVFPFTYKGQTFDKCVLEQTYIPPRSSNQTFNKSPSSFASKTWCGVSTNGLVTSKGDWDYCACTESQRKKSVVLFILDDLRPELPVYGRYETKAPNIEELAKRPGSVVLERAYTLFPLCAPSRASFLSALSPDYTWVVDSYGRGLRQRRGFRSKIKTIPQIFKENGYYTAGGGKIFHLNHDDPRSWNKYYYANRNQNVHSCSEDALKLNMNPLYFAETKFSCKTQAPESSLLDFNLGASATKTLQSIVMKRQEPFFFVVGLFKPHIPQHAQQRFWDLYPSNGVKDTTRIIGPTPQDSYEPLLTFDSDSEMVSPLWDNDTSEQRKFRNTMRTGYLAALSQSDEIVGRILDKLSQLKLTDSTMIVLIGDNGVALGENGMFGKDTNFEIAARVPAIFHIPWAATTNSAKGIARLGDIFQLTDLMSTITSIMNVPLNPKFPNHGVNHGPRLVALASGRNMNSIKASPARTLAFSQIVRCISQPACQVVPLKRMAYVGYSVRTIKWRYSAYLRLKNGRVLWEDGILSEELYSHDNDQSTLLNYAKGAVLEVETVNLAPKNRKVCAEMFSLIQKRFKIKYSVDTKPLAW